MQICQQPKTNYYYKQIIRKMINTKKNQQIVFNKSKSFGRKKEYV